MSYFERSFWSKHLNVMGFASACASMMKVLEPVNKIVHTGVAKLNITPAYYSFMFPPMLQPHQIQEHFRTGVLPSVNGLLAPALTFCVIFSVMRYFLHVFVIQVMFSELSTVRCCLTVLRSLQPIAESTMQIKEEPLDPIAEIDAEFRHAGKFVDVRSAIIGLFCCLFEADFKSCNTLYRLLG
jgi:hypothetical protein